MLAQEEALVRGVDDDRVVGQSGGVAERLLDRSLRYRLASYRSGELTVEERAYVSRLVDQVERMLAA